jgi:putative Ca2+/H+ antiporter (TMEM165/GDT1 family)
MQKHSIILSLLLFAVLIQTSFSLEEGQTVSEDITKDPKKGIVAAFAESFSSIVVSELGDKTFFIAAIMAMRYNRIAVLSGALTALFIMTGISTAFGSIVPIILPPMVTHIMITILFFFFGFKLLYDAYNDHGEESHEKSEVEIELNQVHTKLIASNKGGKQMVTTFEYNDALQHPQNEADIELNIESSPMVQEDCVRHVERVASKLVFWQALTLTFLGEWGDRSQITTIALAVEGNATMVFIGSFLGHVLCTCLAVIGGKFLANKISEKTVNICGGILFLIFGVHNLFLKV